MKKKGYNGHIGLWREKPCKNLGGKRQKIAVEPCRVGERKESLKNFWKKMFWTSQDLTFKKAHLWFSIDWKSILIDWNRQKILKEILIDRKTDWINRKSRKIEF